MNRIRTLALAALIASTSMTMGTSPVEASASRPSLPVPPCNVVLLDTCWMVKKGATESNICHTGKALASHKVYSGTANLTFTTAESFSTTVSADLGLSWGALTAKVGTSIVKQQTTGFSVTVPNVKAGQTAKIYSRANRTQYSIQRFVKVLGTWYPATGLTQGTVITPIRGSFCSFVYNF